MLFIQYTLNENVQSVTAPTVIELKMMFIQSHLYQVHSKKCWVVFAGLILLVYKLGSFHTYGLLDNPFVKLFLLGMELFV